MSESTDDSGSRMLAEEFEDGSSGGSWGVGAAGAEGRELKKGPWTSAEDAILVEYVKKNGEGNWNALHKSVGLSRCGKSCRLRWANHLKPNLKKGAFTQAEENMILELHARMGNKWARMAAFLPGRTDNEIKNYWNTRVKRCQRAGLPLYPPHLSLLVSNENKQSQNSGEISSGNKRNYELLHGSPCGVPDVKQDIFEVNQGALSYAPPFPDISVGSMLSTGFGSQSYGFMKSTAIHVKQLAESETLFPGLHGSAPPSVLPTFGRFQSDSSGKIKEMFGSCHPCVPGLNRQNLAPISGACSGSGSHALLNGNFCTSKPIHWTEKSELPSLQYPETGLCSWLTSPYTPPHPAVDMPNQSPPANASLQCEPFSPRDTGLLDALIQEAHTMCSARNQKPIKSSNSSAVAPNDKLETPTPMLQERNCREYSDSVSSLGCSATSGFSVCTPPMSSSDELPFSKATSGTDISPATAESVLLKRGTSSLPDFSRPDALLGSDWLVQGSESANECCVMDDTIASLLGDDSCDEYKQVLAGTPSTSELDSYTWNSMPFVCSKAEFPKDMSS